MPKIGFVKRTYFEGEICGLIYNTAKLLLYYTRITGALVIVQIHTTQNEFEW